MRDGESRLEEEEEEEEYQDYCCNLSLNYEESNRN
jgi:hypothetical protein